MLRSHANLLGVALLLVIMGASSLWPTHAQVQTEEPPSPPSPSVSGPYGPFPVPGAPTPYAPAASPSTGATPVASPGTSASASPAASPSPTPRRRPTPRPAPTPTPVYTGRIDVTVEHFSDFYWRYNIDNGTASALASIQIFIPTERFDSRMMLDGPGGWSGTREPGEGPWRNYWALSWFNPGATSVNRRLTMDLRSGAHMVRGAHDGRMLFGGGPYDRRRFPWEVDFDFIPLSPAYRYPAARELMTVPYPVFCYDPPREPVLDLEQAVTDHAAHLDIFGSGRHTGENFSLTVNADRRAVFLLRRGRLLMPSQPQFDVQIVGRTERVALDMGDVATFRLRCYSLSYGRLAPPARLQFYDLTYRLASADASEPSLSPTALAAYRQILARADHMAITTPSRIGVEFPDLTVQWALWRQERLFEGRPLSIHDMEKNLALWYRWAGTGTSLTPGPVAVPKRVYLDPVEVRDVARSMWSLTDILVYGEPLRELPVP